MIGRVVALVDPGEEIRMILDRYLLAMFNASNQNTRREFRWPLIGTASLSALVYPVMSEDGTGNVLFESFADVGAGNAGRFLQVYI